jgi:hypothetical protein
MASNINLVNTTKLSSKGALKDGNQTQTFKKKKGKRSNFIYTLDQVYSYLDSKKRTRSQKKHRIYN